MEEDAKEVRWDDVEQALVLYTPVEESNEATGLLHDQEEGHPLEPVPSASGSNKPGDAVIEMHDTESDDSEDRGFNINLANVKLETLHPLVKGTIVLVASPVVAAGGVLWGAGNILLGLGDLLTGGSWLRGKIVQHFRNLV